MLPDQQAESLITTVGKSVCSTVIEDAAVQAAMQPWVRMECYQLGRGRRLGRMDCMDLETHQIVREHQEVAVQKMGVTPPNLCIISCCTPDPTFRFSELRAGDTDMVFFMPENKEFDIYVPAGARTSYVSLDQEEFLSGARILDPAEWERAPEDLIHIPAASQPALERMVNRWLAAIGTTATPTSALDEDTRRRMLLQDILEIVKTSPGCQPSSTDRLRAFQVCRSARAYLEDRLMDDSLPTIVDICRYVGVAERTLQYAFRAYADMSPLAYLRLCRLNRARAGLSRPSAMEITVTEVATRFGFFHLGKFARDYRLHFGESPSQALARGLRLAA